MGVLVCEEPVFGVHLVLGRLVPPISRINRRGRYCAKHSKKSAEITKTRIRNFLKKTSKFVCGQCYRLHKINVMIIIHVPIIVVIRVAAVSASACEYQLR